MILFVLVDAILLNLDFKKRTSWKFFFQVSTILSNMFTYHIQNLEIYNAFIISEPEFTVWSNLILTAGVNICLYARINMQEQFWEIVSLGKSL